MRETQTITAQPREGTGKGSARAARRNGLVPAIIYGGKMSPASVVVNRKQVLREIETGVFSSTLYEIDLAGDKQRVLPRDVQVDPVTDIPIHVDFLRLSGDSTISIMVPVDFTDQEESPGLKRGGVLNVVRRDIELTCRADAIPDRIAVSLAGLEINDIVHISAVELPEGVAPTITDRDFTVASIASPTVIRDEAAEEAEEGEEEEEVEGVEGAEDEAEDGAAAEDGDRKPEGRTEPRD